MPRFESLKYSPADTRRTIRDRLRRCLPVSRTVVRQQKPASRSTDELVLRILCDVTIEFGDDTDAFRTSYEVARQSVPSAPTFDELVKAGSIRAIWGRVSLAAPGYVSGQSDDPRQAVLAAMGRRYERTIRPGVDI